MSIRGTVSVARDRVVRSGQMTASGKNVLRTATAKIIALTTFVRRETAASPIVPCPARIAITPATVDRPPETSCMADGKAMRSYALKTALPDALTAPGMRPMASKTIVHARSADSLPVEAPAVASRPIRMAATALRTSRMPSVDATTVLAWAEPSERLRARAISRVSHVPRPKSAMMLA